MPYGAREMAKEKKKITIIYSGNESYAAIYSEDNEIVVKKCVIDKNKITIDKDGFCIWSISNQEYNNQQFDIVELRVID